MRDRWSELSALASRRVFSTYEWASAWWAEYGRDRMPQLLPGGRGRRVTRRGPAPVLCRDQRGVKVARLIGHGAGDARAGVLPRGERRRRRGDARLGADGDAGGRLSGGVDARGRGLGEGPRRTVLRRSANPVTLFPTDDWDGFLATMSRNARSQLRSRERRLFREQGATYRVTSSRDELDADLDTFFALHRLRWGAASSLLRREPFYRSFAATALDLGWLQLSILSAGDTPIASGLDFRYAGIQSQYNSVRDPAWDDHSPGTVLRAITMRDALAVGVREFRSARRMRLQGSVRDGRPRAGDDRERHLGPRQGRRRDCGGERELRAHASAAGFLAPAASSARVPAPLRH